jgi:hypothetical protein
MKNVDLSAQRAIGLALQDISKMLSAISYDMEGISHILLDDKMDNIFTQAVEVAISMSGICKSTLHDLEINQVIDLVKSDPKELLKHRNFGSRFLNNITKDLQALGLRFGMTEEEIHNWTPPPPASP